MGQELCSGPLSFFVSHLPHTSLAFLLQATLHHTTQLHLPAIMLRSGYIAAVMDVHICEGVLVHTCVCICPV